MTGQSERVTPRRNPSQFSTRPVVDTMCQCVQFIFRQC